MKFTSNIDKIPSFYNEEFINKIMRNVEPNRSIGIEEVHIVIEGDNAGNFCSDLHRLRITFSSNSEVSLILKVLNKANTSVFLKTLDVCEKERIMYFEVLPAVDTILGNQEIGPKCFYYSLEPVIYLVLEDLTSLGYKLQNRETGMDRKHSALVMSQIAKFHAASLELTNKQPNILTNFQYGFLNPIHIQRTNSYRIIEENLSYVITLAQNWKEYETISQKLKQIEKQLTKKCFTLLNSHKSKIKTINHGDLWTNNIMFKYEQDNDPKQLKLIDFQLCFYTSIGYDINYFLHSSLQFDVLQNNREELIDIYYESFVYYLKELKYQPIPTLEDVLNEILDFEFHSLFVIIGILPVVSIDINNSTNMSIEELKISGDKKRSFMFSSDRVLCTLKYTLKRLEALGILDKLSNIIV